MMNVGLTIGIQLLKQAREGPCRAIPRRTIESAAAWLAAPVDLYTDHHVLVRTGAADTDPAALRGGVRRIVRAGGACRGGWLDRHDGRRSAGWHAASQNRPQERDDHR